jgi:hypothetical protein
MKIDTVISCTGKTNPVFFSKKYGRANKIAAITKRYLNPLTISLFANNFGSKKLTEQMITTKMKKNFRYFNIQEILKISASEL